MGAIWQHSGSIERDGNDNRAVAATAEFFVGGTTTPLTVYSDASESTAHPNPVVASGSGRWPFVSIPFCTSYDVKVSTAGGTQLYYYRGIPNADPVTAAADTVDDTQLIQTGDIIFSPKTGTRTGFVRCNARTIGSAASGATERANPDTSDLYEFLWNNFADGICAVATGRGGSAAADFGANKAITLLDGRGGVVRGVDDMGNTAASALTLATFTTGSATTGGSIAGANTHQLTTAQLAAHTHTGTTGNESVDHSHTGTTLQENVSHTHAYSGTTSGQSVDHSHTYTGGSSTGTGVLAGGGGNFAAFGAAITGGASVDHNHTYSGTSGNPSSVHTHTFQTNGVSASHTHSFTSANTGSDTAHNNVSKSILGNLLIKL
jgi:hypothetical protein